MIKDHSDALQQSDKLLERLAELAKKATPGPWSHGLGQYMEDNYVGAPGSLGEGSVYVCETATDKDMGIKDAEFISNANPQTVSALVKALVDVRELHEEQDDFFGGSYCKLCSREELFPCPTIQAIDSSLKEISE